MAKERVESDEEDEEVRGERVERNEQDEKAMTVASMVDQPGCTASPLGRKP